MKLLKSDKCRVCMRTFCCTSCRERHETSKHSFFAECDICKYGQIIISPTLSEKLLDHLKTIHFPLRCELCTKTFDTIDELFLYIKCTEANKVLSKNNDGKNPKTPTQTSYEANYDSPPLANILMGKNGNKNINLLVHLATSTPMHHGGGTEKVKEIIITPVESTENTKNSILKNPNSRCNYSSKRVTFSGTPFIESSHRKPKNMVMTETTTGMMVSPSTFHTAKIEQTTSIHSSSDVKTSEIKNEENEPSQDPIKTNEEKPKNVLEITAEDDNTVWISALNLSIEICSDEDEHKENEEHKDEDEMEHENHEKNEEGSKENKEQGDKQQSIPKSNVATPVAPKSAHRKVSIVKPTPAKKEKKEEQLFVDMIQTFSTPNVPRAVQPPAHAIFANSDTNPARENTASAVSIIAIPPAEVTANISAPAVVEQPKPNETYDVDCMTSDTGMSRCNTIWTSVSSIVSNIFHNFSGIDTSYQDRADNSLKRCSSDNDIFEPLRKKYKFTDIKCRRPIRDLPPLEISNDLQISIRVNITEGTKKIYVDKATNTDESMYTSR
ncbi:unnamed protein product [Acanthoscelides obtectus]|uniref:C2H2-type domain-containing protein n=1 Tax=Acanthoscelides obtectus TaxID=200917 RepID=A0A9P0K0R2_ACAOB|nr:unnamed protein product [Acanthoscelides obtectus]CAK1629077.1 Mitosis initiation protein fs(1)Ya [Acanthoscelides obtectus]